MASKTMEDLLWGLSSAFCLLLSPVHGDSSLFPGNGRPAVPFLQLPIAGLTLTALLTTHVKFTLL